MTGTTRGVLGRSGRIAGVPRAMRADEGSAGGPPESAPRPVAGDLHGAARRPDGGRWIVRAARTAAVVSVMAAVPMLAGCGQGAQANGTDGGARTGDGRPVEGERADRSPGGEPASGTEREARAGGEAGARAGDAVAGGGKDAEEEPPGANVAKEARNAGRNDGDGSEKVVLRVGGGDGTSFAGTCSVGDEERRIGGQTPQRFTFSPEGKKLECGLRAEGPGTLEFELAAGDEVRSVQRSGSGESEVGFAYHEGRISVSQSSSGSGNQVQSFSGSFNQVQSSSVSDVSSGDTPAP